MEQVDECCLNYIFRVDVSLMLAVHGVLKTTSHVAVPLKTVVTVPIASPFLAVLLFVHVLEQGLLPTLALALVKVPPIPPPPPPRCRHVSGFSV